MDPDVPPRGDKRGEYRYTLRRLPMPDAGGHHVAYRPDIDGLRALAILAVVGYPRARPSSPAASWASTSSSCISGFLISSILLSDLSAGDFSFARFYARRARRILPALLVVLIGSGLIGWVVLVGGEFRDLQRNVAAAATFVTNLLLWREAGYFDVSARFKPLQHLWSLAVEEQFYLLWPTLLYVAWRRRLNAASFIAGDPRALVPVQPDADRPQRRDRRVLPAARPAVGIARRRAARLFRRAPSRRRPAPRATSGVR